MIKKPSVQFHFLISCTLADRGVLKKFINFIFKKEKRPLEKLTIIFCDDQYLLGLNRRFLKHNYYTDILSFPMSEGNKPLVGEIYISVERVRENARSAGSTFRVELHRVIFHGVLHFCGYLDKSASDIRLMRKMEDNYLGAYRKLLS
jgi:probable rRNA maturation factor